MDPDYAMELNRAYAMNKLEEIQAQGETHTAFDETGRNHQLNSRFLVIFYSY